MKIGVLVIPLLSAIAFVQAGPIVAREPQDPRGCRRKCMGPRKCMSNEEVRRRMTSSGATCQTCIEAKCGAVDQYVNKATRLTCVRNARNVCVSCQITEADEARMLSCESCLSKCSGQSHSGSITDSVSPGSSGWPGSPYTPETLGTPEGDHHERLNEPDEKTLRDCFKGCVAAENCTSLKEVRRQIKATSSDCRACIEEECGSYETSNKTDIVVCIWDAKEDCHECPDVTDEEEDKMESCDVCMANCPFFQDSGDFTTDSETPQTPKHLGTPEVPGHNQESSQDGDNEALRDCFKSCVAAENCTSLKEVKKQIKATGSACRSCIREECGEYEKGKDTNTVDCILDARGDCDECPDLTDAEEAKQDSCGVCMENCLPDQGPHEGGLEGEYESPGYPGGESPRTPHPTEPEDPSPVQAVTPTVLSQSDVIKTIFTIRAIFPISAVPQLMACFNNHQTCATCPSVGELSATCAECKKCTDNPAFSIQGGPIGAQEPQDQRGCQRKCVGPGKCMTTKEINQRLTMSGAACQTCIEAKCGPVQRYANKTRLFCVRNVRYICVSCPFTEADEARMLSCESCLSKCPGEDSRDSNTDSETPQTPQNLPEVPVQGGPICGQEPQDPRGCQRKCVGPGKCMSSKEIHQRLTTSGATCQTCIEAKCGPVEQYVANKTRLICVRNMRHICVSCKITEADESRMLSCQSCLSKCPGQDSTDSTADSETPQTPKSPGTPEVPVPGGPIGGQEPQDPRGCQRKCVGPGKCMSNKEIHSRMAAGATCKTCIEAKCGPVDHRINKTRLICVRNMRDICVSCKITEADKARLLSCQSCVSKCPGEDSGDSTTDSETPKSPKSPGMQEVPGPAEEGDSPGQHGGETPQTPGQHGGETPQTPGQHTPSEPEEPGQYAP